MKNDLSRLLDVQEKERRLLVLEEEQRAIPRALDAFRRRISGIENEVAAIKNSIQGLQVKRKDLDLESESKLEAVAKYQKQQFEVKTNVEYQALQKEIVNRKVENSRIEDKILEIMEQVEEKERLVKEHEDVLKGERERITVEEKKVEGEIAKLGEQIVALQVERDKLLPGISPKVLSKYQRIFKNKRDTAIVPLVDYTCGGCHMLLPPQAANNVRKLDELVICENCSRILYWADGIAKEGEAAQPVSQETAG
ncbi:MAG: C4-type zinc ribbon domain-containing protein [Candidatus Aureabacteria bacterium]|nr:C4-type zinc ribbon domain-containing protein [Candidatus Auribacterota bacterium]